MSEISEVIRLPNGDFGIEYSDGTNKVTSVGDIPNHAEYLNIKSIVASDGILKYGGRESSIGSVVFPDPRKRIGALFSFCTTSTSTQYIDPTYDRRIVVTQDISSTNSGVNASAGQDFTLFPSATSPGLRWDEPNRPFRMCSSQGNNSVGVITIKES